MFDENFLLEGGQFWQDEEKGFLDVRIFGARMIVSNFQHYVTNLELNSLS
jgi:hypothetical protein